MAADKEMASYEAAAGQPKPPPFPLPAMQSATNNSNHKMKKQSSDDDESKTHNNSQPSGYYLNVAQKGKLILPTALWILLIIAGICFLTLLASLNKSMSALDDLIELEEEKVAKLEAIERSQKHHIDSHLHGRLKHRGGHHHNHADDGPLLERKWPTENNKQAANADHPATSLDLQFSDASPMESSKLSSLLDFPFALLGSPERPTVVEPGRKSTGHGLMSPLSLFGRPNQSPVQSEQPESMSGTIVITSMSGPESDSQSNQLSDPGLIDSIFRQFMPEMLGGPMKQLKPEEPAQVKEGSAPLPAGPLISAKIGKINVNINTNEKDEEEPTAKIGPKKTHRHESEPTLDSTGQLESSINSLVSKLMDEQQQPTSFVKRPSPLSPLSNLLGSPFGSSMISGLPSSSFVIEQVVPVESSGPASLRQHQSNHRHPHRPMHSLGKHHDNHHHHQHAHSHQMPVLIALDGPDFSSVRPTSSLQPSEDIVMDIRPLGASGEVHRHGLSNTRRPSFGQSPYEFAPLGGQQQPDDVSQLLSSLKLLAGGDSSSGSTKRPSPSRAPGEPTSGQAWNGFADDMAGSVMQSLLLQEQKPATTSKNNAFVVIDSDKNSNTDKQLASGEQKLSTLFPPVEVMNGAKGANQMGDLFSLLFGPPPASKLAVAPQPGAGPALASEQASSPPSIELKIEPIQSDAAATPTAGATTDKPTDSPATIQPALPSTAAPIVADQTSSGSKSASEGETTDELRKDLESMVNNLFSLPQSSGQSNPMRLSGGGGDERGSSGGASGGGEGGSGSSPTGGASRDNANEMTTTSTKSPASESVPFNPESIEPTTTAATNVPTTSRQETIGASTTIGPQTSTAAPTASPVAPTEPQTSSTVASSTVEPSSTPAPTTTVAAPTSPATAPNRTSPTVRPTEVPLKTFLQKADEFIVRNIKSLKRLF